MTHIDDWLDDPANATDIRIKEWFRHYRRPVVRQDRDWLNARKLFCQYKGNRYRCTGCSRLGDVWLAKDIDRERGYDLRVNIDDCSDWTIDI